MDEAPEGPVQRRVAEVVEPALPPRLVEQQLRLEAHHGTNDPTPRVERARDHPQIHHVVTLPPGASTARTRLVAASTCQAISPGRPSTISRTRFVSESASDVSGPRPSAPPNSR